MTPRQVNYPNEFGTKDGEQLAKKKEGERERMHWGWCREREGEVGNGRGSLFAWWP